MTLLSLVALAATHQGARADDDVTTLLDGRFEAIVSCIAAEPTDDGDAIPWDLTIDAGGIPGTEAFGAPGTSEARRACVRDVFVESPATELAGKELHVTFRVHGDKRGVQVVAVDTPFTQEVSPLRVLRIIRPKKPLRRDYRRARQDRIRCEFVLVLNREGLVEEVETLDCPEPFREYAVPSLLAWRFEPAIIDGVPVRGRFELAVTFER